MDSNWKDITGYEGYYQVSDCGLVRSLDREVAHSSGNGVCLLRGQILSAGLSNGRHLVVVLCKFGIPTNKKVHRLVAEAFLGPCPDGQEVRHGKSGSLDNSVENLCYGTRSENNLDRRRDGTSGKKVRRSDGKVFWSLQFAAEETGCSAGNICSVCKGHRNTAGGFGWEYV